MKTIKINDVKVKCDSEKFNEEMANEIFNYVKENKTTQEDIDTITAKVTDDKTLDIDIEYVQPHKIERLRRITGYLTTSLDRWNKSKQCEEADRVKHI